MSGHPVNNLYTSFGRQAKNHDNNTPSAPASLPSVPSFGTLQSIPSFGTIPSVNSFGNEEWCNFHFNRFADASTTSASPFSPYSPGFASGASSVGIAGSYSTTPLSSTSFEMPRSSLASHLETSSLLQSTGLNLEKHRSFILEDPAVAKHKKDKAMRACTPCFTRRLECSESETPSRCKHCSGKTSYCKGPIETPCLLDLKWFDTTLATLLTRYYQSIGFLPNSENCGPMDVELELELPCEQDFVSDRQTHRLQLPGLQDDFHFFWEPSNFDGMLDAISSADGPLCIAPKAGFYDLSSYERLCRRLCACILLLRHSRECTLDNAYKNDHRAILMVLGFLRQLNRTASSILAEIFGHIRGCCFAKRDRRGTPKLMSILAEHLGHLHRELRHFMEVMGQFSDSASFSPLTGMLLDGSQNLNEIENLGRGLCPRAFESTYQSFVPDVARMHIRPHFEPYPNNEIDKSSTLSQHISFVDILHDSALPQTPTWSHPLPMVSGDDTSKPWPNVDIELPTPLIGHDLQDDFPNGQDILVDNRTSFGLKGMQAEADAMLNPPWPLRLHDFAFAQNAEASVDLSDLSAEILNSMPHDQVDDWDQPRSQVQQAGHAYLLQGTCSVSASADIGGSVLTSPPDIIELSQAQSNASQPLETATNTALSNTTKQLCSFPNPTTAKAPRRASKRKLIKTVFSRKKPCLASSLRNDSEGMSPARTDLLSKLATRAESAAKTTTISGAISLQQPSNDCQKEHIRAEWVPVQERGSSRRIDLDNAGTVSDIKVSDSERRPMSWPHRNPWRKSLDISVAALTKGFERLVKERGESSLSAI